MILRCCMLSPPIALQYTFKFLIRTSTTSHSPGLKHSETISPSILISGKKAIKIANVFLSYGFKKEQITHIFNSPHAVLSFGEKDLVSNLAAWNAFEVNKKLLIVFTRYPELLTLTPEYIDNRAKELMTIFTKADIKKLLITCPKVFLDDFDNIEEKVKYIVHLMGVEQKSIVKSEALQFNLTHIKCRHIFMSRAGFYKVKKKIVQPKSPPLNKMFNRNLENFLKLSRLTREEYETFVTAYEFEENENLAYDSDEEY